MAKKAAAAKGEFVRAVHRLDIAVEEGKRKTRDTEGQPPKVEIIEPGTIIAASDLSDDDFEAFMEAGAIRDLNDDELEAVSKGGTEAVSGTETAPAAKPSPKAKKGAAALI